MPLIETLTIGLAPAIAKAIVKLWIKDADIAVDLTSSVVELVGKKTGDVIARQRAKRQFEEIGEKITQNLRPAPL